MESRRSGLVHTWDIPKRCFQYSYIPRYNETLEIVELPFGSLSPPENGGRKLSIKDVPPEVAAEINISLGSSGMYYYTLTWWERRKVDFAAWQERASKRLEIWWLKVRLAWNWCVQQKQKAKIWFLEALLGEGNGPKR